MTEQVTKAKFRAVYQSHLQLMPWWTERGQSYMEGVDRLLAGSKTIDIRGPIIEKVWCELGLPKKPSYAVLHALPD